MKTTTVAIVMAIALQTTGCTGGGSGCPDQGDDLTWASYGDWELGSEGRDSTARGIVDDCDWHVEGGHNGGIGGTLQVADSGEDVIFVWAYNDFSAFVVRDKWSGETEHGARLGDSISEFLEAHPNFSRLSSQTYARTGGGRPVIARFDSGNRLEEIEVGSYYRQ